MLVLPQTRRSDDSRARILAAARSRFSEVGFERTTIRSVAAAANIDPSMVMRYFGSKEGLFAAAAEIHLDLPELDGCTPEEAGHLLAAATIRLWQAGGALELLLRSAVSNASAAARLRDVIATELGPALTPLLPEAEARIDMIASHMLGYGVGRRIVDLPGLKDAEPLLAKGFAALLG